jgi:hypothetical protein
MTVYFAWTARTPGETSWDDEVLYDSWGKGDLLNRARMMVPRGRTLRSNEPLARWVYRVGDRFHPCHEHKSGARAAWIWITE